VWSLGGCREAPLGAPPTYCAAPRSTGDVSSRGAKGQSMQCYLCKEPISQSMHPVAAGNRLYHRVCAGTFLAELRREFRGTPDSPLQIVIPLVVRRARRAVGEEGNNVDT